MVANAQIILNVKGGVLTVAATPMGLAEMNLYLDLAKLSLLRQGKPDEQIAAHTEGEAQSAGILLKGAGNGR